MSAEQLNAFLRQVSDDSDLQTQLRRCDAQQASGLAQRLGYDVSVGDLIRYMSRSTTWELTDAELAVVADWQPRDQPFWWQHIWAQSAHARTFADVASHSVYGTTGFLATADDLRVAEEFLIANLPVLRCFRQVVVATNYDDHTLVADNAAMWRSHLPDCVLLDSAHNRGHSIGTSDLDNMLFDHCKAHGFEWLCKSANDVHLTPAVLQIPVADGDFYFLNAVSYDAIRQPGRTIADFTGEYFWPQTTFYAINVAATDYLVDPGFLDRSWNTVRTIPGYNGRIWEHITGWACETLLRNTVLRNGLRRVPLMTDSQWLTVLGIVVDQQITDCSFKGIEINGICHGWPAQIISAAGESTASMP